MFARDRVADKQDRLAVNPVKVGGRNRATLIPVIQTPELLEEAGRLARQVVRVPSVEVRIGEVNLELASGGVRVAVSFAERRAKLRYETEAIARGAGSQEGQPI